METKVIHRLSYGLIVAIGLMVSSCEKIEADTALQAKPVVEAYLASNHPASVKVTPEVLFTQSDTLQGISGLNIKISVDGQSYPMTYDIRGIYNAPSLIVEEHKSYAVQFDYQNKTISSSTTIPGQPSNFKVSDSTYTIAQFNSSLLNGFPTFPDPITLTWNNDEQTYYLVVVKNIETSPAPINTGITQRESVFRSSPIQTNTFQIRARQFQYYGRHWIILYKINAEYASLYQNNGNSSLTIKTPYTNVTNGLGIFTGINADTLIVRVKK